MMHSLRPPPAAAWPKLILMSRAASGVACHADAATPSKLPQILPAGRPNKLAICGPT
jgi:hypothetical protein